MYSIEKICFYCIYLLCFSHILVLSHSHGEDHSGSHHGHFSHSVSRRSRMCLINVTSENDFVQKEIRCYTSCCENACCPIETITIVMGIFYITFAIIVSCCVIENACCKRKTYEEDLYQEESLQMQPSDKLNNVESSDGVQNYGSNSYVNAAMLLEEAPCKIAEDATFKPSTSSHWLGK